MTSLRPAKAHSRPSGMARVNLPPDMRAFVEAEALDIFTTMVNGGCTLQQTLTAIFLSGMNAAHTMRNPT